MRIITCQRGPLGSIRLRSIVLRLAEGAVIYRPCLGLSCTQDDLLNHATFWPRLANSGFGVDPLLHFHADGGQVYFVSGARTHHVVDAGLFVFDRPVGGGLCPLSIDVLNRRLLRGRGAYHAPWLNRHAGTQGRAWKPNPPSGGENRTPRRREWLLAGRFPSFPSGSEPIMPKRSSYGSPWHEKDARSCNATRRT